MVRWSKVERYAEDDGLCESKALPSTVPSQQFPIADSQDRCVGFFREPGKDEEGGDLKLEA